MLARHQNPMWRSFFFLLLCLSSPVIADRWMMARSFETASSNRSFVARVSLERPPGAKGPTLELFSVKENGSRTQEWQADLSNRGVPFEVLVTDDGRHVVTLDNHARVGYGDDVVAIYAKTGLIRKYSLEQIAGDALKPRFGKSLRSVNIFNYPHSAGSRWWRNNSIMAVDGAGDGARLAIWLAWAQRWYVWKLADGSIEELNDDALKKWDDFGWDWAQTTLAGKRVDGRARQPQRGLVSGDDEDKVTACRYLGYTKKPVDRKLLEKLLENKEKNRWGDNELRKYATWSLALLDGFDPDLLEEERDGFTRMGMGKVTVRFPEKLTGSGTIYCYVFPESVKADGWREAESVGGMTLTFHSDLNERTIDFDIEPVKGGRYWTKVVWMRGQVEDFHADIRERKQRPRPVPGPKDFQTAGAPLFEITPGKSVDVQIDCDRPGATP
jgi:hypothetical protein